jgi:putative endonuclease
MFWMYMLRCVDGSFYVGHTDNLEVRLAAHEQGVFATCYTFTRRPVELVFSEAFPTREEALAMERRVKGWSRAKKQALIVRDWKAISLLAKSRAESTVGSTQSPSTSSGRTDPVTGSGRADPSTGSG